METVEAAVTTLVELREQAARECAGMTIDQMQEKLCNNCDNEGNPTVGWGEFWRESPLQFEAPPDPPNPNELICLWI